MVIVDNKTISDRSIRRWFCNGGPRPSDIPADVIWEILSHFSANDLYRAKSLSREWNSIISNYNFMETHSNRTPPCLGLLISTANSESREFEFYYARLERRLLNGNFYCRLSVPYSDYEGLTQVVHGVVCFYSADRVSILNVCTREMQDLPQPPIHENVFRTRCYLGFDKSSKAYKLLRLTKIVTPPERYPGETVVEILTITTPISSCRWRGVRTRYDVDEIRTPSFCVNGNLYWMHTYSYPRRHGCAVVFDLEREKFHADYVQSRDPSRIASRLGIFSGSKIHGSVTSVIKYGGALLTLYSWSEFSGSSGEAAIKFPVVFPDGVSQGCRFTMTEDLPTGDRLPGDDDEGFVVPKFPRFVASLSKIEKASYIVCLEERLTPLHLLLGGY